MKNLDNKYLDAISWLYEIGCDEVVDFTPRDNSNVSGIEDNNLVISKSENIDIFRIVNDIDSFETLESFVYKSNVEKYKNYKFFNGFNSSDLMVVGDYPTEEELSIGKPFQGKAGNLLDAMLQAIDFDKTNTFYTNFYNQNIRDSNKNLKNESKFFLSILFKQIELVNPKVVIVFGAEVCNALTGNEEGIFVSRGKWFDLKTEGAAFKFSAVSMFHPRHILANPVNKKEAWEDLKAIKRKFS